MLFLPWQIGFRRRCGSYANLCYVLQLPNSFHQPLVDQSPSYSLYSERQFITFILTNVTIHHSLPVSLLAQNSPAQQILPFCLPMPTEILHRLRSSLFRIFHVHLFLNFIHSFIKTGTDRKKHKHEHIFLYFNINFLFVHVR